MAGLLEVAAKILVAAAGPAGVIVHIEVTGGGEEKTAVFPWNPGGGMTAAATRASKTRSKRVQK